MRTLIKWFALLGWIFVCVKSWIYLFTPVIAAYGFWPMLGMLFGFFIAAFILSFIFFYLHGTEPEDKPQASYRA